jgi:hypothetical protein
MMICLTAWQYTTISLAWKGHGPLSGRLKPITDLNSAQP